MRIGHGYDVHKLVEGRKLILGGVDIPWEKGLLGHSDADVLTHAIMDALLGAAALGDIGKLFPDNAPAYAGADSLVLLERVGSASPKLGTGWATLTLPSWLKSPSWPLTFPRCGPIWPPGWDWTWIRSA